MQRHALTEAQWQRQQRVLPKQKAGPEAIRGDRLFIEAVLFRAKTGLQWRDLPERFGPWKSVYNRFSNWARQGRHEAAALRHADAGATPRADRCTGPARSCQREGLDRRHRRLALRQHLELVAVLEHSAEGAPVRDH